MDDFKKKSLVSYSLEMSYAEELGKKKLRKYEKRMIRRLSRAKMKNQDRKINKEM